MNLLILILIVAAILSIQVSILIICYRKNFLKYFKSESSDLKYEKIKSHLQEDEGDF